MKCPRCSGTMIRQPFWDYQGSTGWDTFEGWRCMACGEVIDPVLLANRTSPAPSPANRGRKGPRRAA